LAERRMFSKSITQSARFLKMPLSSQALYFQMGLSADDDGIVEAFPVMRMTGAAEDDLKVLVAKGFIKILNEDLVAFIVHWKDNNIIRKDRYHKSIYHDLLSTSLPENCSKQTSDNQVTTSCQPNDNQVPTNGIPSIGKVSIDKISVDKENTGKSSKEKESVGNIEYISADASMSQKTSKLHTIEPNSEPDNAVEILERELPLIAYFKEQYKLHTGKEHPSISFPKLIEIAKSLYDKDTNTDSVDEYFGHDGRKGLCGDSDCSIFHFASDGVQELLMKRIC
jgi:hypothetical protein